MIKTIFRLIPKKKHISFYWLIFLFIIGGILETLGVGLFIPILNSISNEMNLSIPIIDSIANYVFENIKILNFEATILFFLVIIFLVKNLILLYTIRFQNKFLKDFFLILSNNLLKKYLSQNYIFFVKNNSSKLIRNLSTDLLLLQATIVSLLVFISKFVIFLGILTLLLIVNFKVTLYGTLVLCLLFFLLNKFTKTATVNWGKKRHYFSSQWLKNLQQSFASINILKVYNAENYFLKNYDSSIEKVFESARKHDNLQGVPTLFFEIIILLTLSIFCIYYFSLGYSFISIVPLVSFYFISALRVGPTGVHMYKSLVSFNFAKKTINQLKKEFELKSKISKQDDIKAKFKKSIVFKNLSFRYDNDTPNVLNKINIKFKKNDYVGIIGPSGSGKTTFIGLLIGLIKQNSGKILIDNKEVDNQSKEWIDRVGYVPQNTYLLDASIKENIAFGKFNDQIDLKRVNDSIKKTQLNKFINRLSKKINSNVGERGSRISEGQKQRIGIARALYKKSDILVFDEITSALDILTEKKIMRDINKLKNKKTIFFISHKKEILGKCNKIIEIKGGKIRIIKNV